MKVVNKTFEITYDKGSSTGGTVPAVGFKTIDEAYTVTEETPLTKVGYTQYGWATTEENFDGYYIVEYLYSNAPETLYPVWKANFYDLNVTLNNLTYRGGYGASVIQYGEIFNNLVLIGGNGYSIPSSITVKRGIGESETTLIESIDYSYNQESGSINIFGESIIDDIYITATGNMETFDITYDVNGGNELTEEQIINISSYNVNKESFELPNVTRYSYRFVGWFIKGTFRVSDEVNDYIDLYMGSDFYEWFIENTEIPEDGQPVPYYTTLENENLTSDNAVQTFYCNEAVEYLEDITFMAKWEQKEEVNITLDMQGGIGGSENIITYKDEEMPSATAPKKDGYEFLGYYANNDGTGTQYYDSSMNSINNWTSEQTTGVLYAFYRDWRVIYVSQSSINGDGTEASPFNSFINAFDKFMAHCGPSGGTIILDGNITYEAEINLISLGSDIKSLTLKSKTDTLANFNILTINVGYSSSLKIESVNLIGVSNSRDAIRSSGWANSLELKNVSFTNFFNIITLFGKLNNPVIIDNLKATNIRNYYAIYDSTTESEDVNLCNKLFISGEIDIPTHSVCIHVTQTVTVPEGKTLSAPNGNLIQFNKDNDFVKNRMLNDGYIWVENCSEMSYFNMLWNGNDTFAFVAEESAENSGIYNIVARKQAQVSYNLNYETDETIDSIKVLNGYEFSSVVGPEGIYANNIFVTPNERANYEFIGWSLTETGSVLDENSVVSLNNTTNRNSADFTVYAIWSPKEYTINYNLEGGTNHEDNPVKYTIETETFSLKEPSRDYYTFVGWTFEGQEVPIKNVQIQTNSFGDKTFTAVWEINKYSLTVNETNVDVEYFQASEYYTYNSSLVKVIFKKVKGFDIPKYPSENFVLKIAGSQVYDWSNYIYDYEESSITFNRFTFVGDVEITIKGIEGNIYWNDEDIRADDYSEIDTINKILTITSPEELGKLCYDLNNGSNTISNYLIKIGNDIDLTGYKWMPMLTLNNSFDGQGYTISGIDIEFVDKGFRKNHFGFFSSVGNDEDGCLGINDLILKGKIYGTSSNGLMVGGLFGFGENSCTFSNIGTYIDIDISSDNYLYIGGLAGVYVTYEEAPTCFKNCYAVGSINFSGSDNRYIGGLVGCLEDEMLYNCYYGGIITQDNEPLDGASGIVGNSVWGDFENVYCSDSFIVGNGHNIEQCTIITEDNMIATDGEDALVTKLNNWVMDENIEDYRAWTVDQSVNNGMPIFGEYHIKQFAIEYDLTNLSGSETIAYVNNNDITTLSCGLGYKLPQSITMEMNNENYTSFIYDSTTGNISITGVIDGVITIHADGIIVNYNIVYNLYGGINNSGNPDSYNTEDEIITIKEPTRLGYDFVGWYDNVDFSGEAITNIPTNSIGDKTFYAKWAAKTNTVYIIKFYLQKLDVITEYNYIEEDDVSLLGTTDVMTAIEKDTHGITDTKYIGFTFQNIVNVNITPDGSGVVKVYYKRNLYKLTINTNDSNWGSVDNSTVENVPYGTTLSVNENVLNINGTNITATNSVSTAQYTYGFANWTNGNIFVDKNVTITANFTRIINKYTITWKYGIHTLEIDENIEYGKIPTYDGETPSQESLDTSYKWRFKNWNNGVTAVIGNATYIATFEKLLLVITTPEIDLSNPEDKDRIESEINFEDGVEDNLLFIVKTKPKSEISDSITSPQGQEIVKTYNAQLLKNNAEFTEYTGNMTIKIATPVEMENRQNVKVVIMDKTTGTAVTKTITIDGDYLLFETNTLGDFAIVADKLFNVNLFWIIFVCLFTGLIVLILLWIFNFKRTITFVLNGNKIGTAKYKRGESLNFPHNLARYKWFEDKEQKNLFIKQEMGWFGFTLYRNNQSSPNLCKNSEDITDNK